MSDPIMDTFYGRKASAQDADDAIMATFNARGRSSGRVATAANDDVEMVSPLTRFLASADPVSRIISSAEAVMADPVAAVSGLVDTRPQFRAAADEWRDVLEGGGGSISEAIAKSTEATPVLGPIIQGALGEVTDQIVAEDYAGAAGSVVRNLIPLAAQKLVRPVVRGVGATGKALERSGVAGYAKAMGGESGPLTESLATQMMDRRLIATQKMGPAAEEAAAAAQAQASQIMPPTVRGAKGRMTRNPARQPLLDEVAFQKNVQTIAEKLNTSSVENILYSGSKMGVVLEAATATARAVGMSGAAGPMAFAKTANILNTARRIIGTPAWKTAAPLAKREFGQALQSGHVERVAEIGAGIIAGVYVPDDFGHREAVSSLAGELDAVPNVAMKRQVVGAKRPVYVNPDGSEYPVPQNVMSQFTGASRLTEFDSPISAYLSAMEKQGKIRKGGRIEFRQR